MDFVQIDHVFVSFMAEVNQRIPADLPPDERQKIIGCAIRVFAVVIFGDTLLWGADNVPIPGLRKTVEEIRDKIAPSFPK